MEGLALSEPLWVNDNIAVLEWRDNACIVVVYEPPTMKRVARIAVEEPIDREIALSPWLREDFQDQAEAIIFAAMENQTDVGSKENGTKLNRERKEAQGTQSPSETLNSDKVWISFGIMAAMMIGMTAFIFLQLKARR